MESETLNEALVVSLGSNYVSHASLVANYWNFHIIVVLGLVGFVVAKDKLFGKATFCAVLLGFIAYATGNMLAVYTGQDQLFRLADLIVLKSAGLDDAKRYADIYKTIPPWCNFLLHIIVDFLVICVIVVRGYPWGATSQTTIQGEAAKPK